MEGVWPRGDLAKRDGDGGVVGEDGLVKHVELDVGPGLKERHQDLS